MLATTGWTAVRGHRGTTALQSSRSAWEHGHLAGHRLPEHDAAPARLARFFASLDARQRSGLVHRYPLAVGNMNGAPVDLRYAANRIALTRQRALEKRRTHDVRLSAVGHQEARRLMHRFDELLRPGRQILAFDPAGSGRIAEVFGDLRRADRISLVVPGVDTDLLTFQREDDRAYSAPVGMAKALYSAERAADSRTRTAVIAWADYTAPAGLGIEAATAMRAAAGSLRLTALLRALPGNAPVALYCHSYGSVVCGVAAPTCPRGSPTSRWPAAPACVPEAPRSWAPRPASGRCGTPTTGSRTCRTWSSAASATVPTRSPAASAPGCSRHGARGDTPGTSCRAPTACGTSRASA